MICFVSKQFLFPISIGTKFKFNQTLIKNKTLAPNIKPSGLIVQIPTYNTNITIEFRESVYIKAS